MRKLTQLWVAFYGLACCQLSKGYFLRQSGGEYHLDNEIGDDSHHYTLDHKPVPYEFGYEIKHSDGHSQYHKEESDEHNVKKGSYGYTDPHGVYRHVDYIADHEGFRVKIRTNEPGTSGSQPAHVQMKADPPPKHLHDVYSSIDGHDMYRHQPQLYFEHNEKKEVHDQYHNRQISSSSLSSPQYSEGQFKPIFPKKTKYTT